MGRRNDGARRDDWRARRVGEYFTLGEFVAPGEPCPSRRTITNLADLCTAFLDPLRRRFGAVTITSGVRSELRNRRVGGAPRSWHLDRAGRGAAAADVRCASGTPDDWYAFLDARRAGGLGRYPGHVHVDNRALRARW